MLLGPHLRSSLTLLCYDYPPSHTLHMSRYSKSSSLSFLACSLFIHSRVLGLLYPPCRMNVRACATRAGPWGSWTREDRGLGRHNVTDSKTQRSRRLPLVKRLGESKASTSQWSKELKARGTWRPPRVEGSHKSKARRRRRLSQVESSKASKAPTNWNFGGVDGRDESNAPRTRREREAALTLATMINGEG